MPESIESDITIIGAGPAGLTAALELSKNGIPCLLVDKGKSPREKVCGDGLSGKVLSALGSINPDYCLELANKSFVTHSSGVRFISPALKMAEIGFRSDNPSLPPGFICKRKDFDHFLLEKVLSRPQTKYIEGFKVCEVVRKDGLFILSDREEKFIINTRLVLVATGSSRGIIRSFDPEFPGYGKEGVGIRAYFQHVEGSADHHPIEIHFLKELLPWYFWIFPFQDGSANVGLALPMELARKNSLSLKELLFHLIQKYPNLRERFSGSILAGKVEAHRLPYFTGRNIIHGDNYLLLGDAAHLIDPFTGEGISNAMISGQLAAQTAARCLEKGDFSRKSTREYEESLYAKLGPELELGQRLQELARTTRLLNLVIGRAAKSQKVRALLEEMLYSMNTKGKLSRPLFYLKLKLRID